MKRMLTRKRTLSTIRIVMKILTILAACLFLLCFPLLLMTSNLRFEVSQIRFYQYGFDKYGISEVTGLSDAELTRAASGLITYFNTSRDSAQVRVVKDGQEIDLFSQRELDHLADVKVLIRLFYTVQWFALAYVLIYITAGFIARKRSFLRQLLHRVFLGGVFTLGLFAVVGMWALIDFDGLFLTFHLTSFSNDLWILDPSKDYLIMMFPAGFFSDAALYLVGGTVIEALFLGGGAWAYLRRHRMSC